jgi:hemoglobin
MTDSLPRQPSETDAGRVDAEAAAAPRQTPGASLGVNEELIRAVVHAFYGQVRRDPALGRIFNRVIGDGWDAHLAKMCDFWSSVLLASGRFKGAPMAAHLRIGDLREAHFARWLALFGQITRSLCTPEQAALFMEKAEMIGQALRHGIAAMRGPMAPYRTAHEERMADHAGST